MNIWVVTIGSSDVQFESERTSKDKGRKSKGFIQQVWHYWYNVEFQAQYDTSFIFEPKKAFHDNGITYRISPRILGSLYQTSSEKVQEEIYSYLEFPLLDNFVKALQEGLQNSTETNEQYPLPQVIFVLLTDQFEILDEDEWKHKESCPYWQDTCELRPILERYFQDRFSGVRCEWIVLKPTSGQYGLDNWNSVLGLVREEFHDLAIAGEKINIDPGQIVYVSHQAGTPAISSAVQFVSLAKFGKQVQFLVSNEYDVENPTEIVSNSEYLRGIQVQQAKELVRSGDPGAALRLLEIQDIKEYINPEALSELEKMVNFFNLNSSLPLGANEFDVEPATQRIVDGLSLIENLFERENYLQGIALLAASQETFLKCSIKHEIFACNVSLCIDGKIKNFKAEDLLKWKDSGLGFISDDELKLIWSTNDVKKLKDLKREALKILNFPIDDNKFNSKLKNIDPNRIDKSEFLLKWLRKLRPDFQPWSLLQWSCVDKKVEEEGHSSDIRNRLMHNLKGVNPKEVIQHLIGNQDDLDCTDCKVVDVYRDHVKSQFIDAINLIGLPFVEQRLSERLRGVADALSIKSK